MCGINLTISVNKSKRYRRFYDILGSNRGPRDSCGIALGINRDSLAIDDELAILGFNCTREAAMNSIKPEHVDLKMTKQSRYTYHSWKKKITTDHVFEVNERTEFYFFLNAEKIPSIRNSLVHGDDVNVLMFESITKNDATDTTSKTSSIR